MMSNFDQKQQKKVIKINGETFLNCFSWFVCFVCAIISEIARWDFNGTHSERKCFHYFE